MIERIHVRSVQVRKLELHNCNLSDMEDNFKTAIDVLHSCNVVEHRRVETTCEDAYLRTHFPIIHRSVFEEN
jgi:hypothetical protein